MIDIDMLEWVAPQDLFQSPQTSQTCTFHNTSHTLQHDIEMEGLSYCDNSTLRSH